MNVNRSDISVVRGDVPEAVQKIKSETAGSIWLYGGAELTASFLNAGLVDEMWLGIVPVILGSGKPLFQDIRQRTHFMISKAAPADGYLSLKLKKT